MINALIIDDDKTCRDLLCDILQAKCPQVNVVKTCASVAEGVEAIHNLQPELVFLDVEMNDGTGFDVLQQVKTIDFDVIFVTGFDQYAVKAFKYSAIDYLMKPVLAEELIQAIERRDQKKHKDEPGEQLKLLLANIRNISRGIQKIAIPSADGLVILDVNDISRLEAEGNYTTFYSAKGKHVVSKTLKEYDELLQDNQFIRVHQSHLVNLNCVKKYVRGDGGYIILNDGATVPVSVRKKQEVIERLSHF